MARRIRNHKLETKTARLDLPVRRKPYFVTVDRGVRLGYRRVTRGAGSWVIATGDGHGGKGPEKKFAVADDYKDADGGGVLTYWQAQDCARAAARSGIHGAEAPVAIAVALDSYEADLKIRNGDIANVARVRGHLSDALAKKSIALVTSRDLRAWRDRIAKTLTPATVNRVCTVLKAALNLAADHDERITTRRAWETGLASIPDAQESRNVILPEQAIRRIIATASEQSDEFGILVETLAITGARTSQVARLEAQDLQDDRTDPRLMMPSSKKGHGVKRITRRPVPIPASLAAKLRRIVEGKMPTDPLLTRPSGEPWKRSNHSQPFALAVIAAGLDPTEVTAYALRHSSIVRQLLANVPVRVVAVIHDTSIAMIERTYSRYIGDHADALARKGLLDLTKGDTTVVNLDEVRRAGTNSI